jgi:hypothetical protein
LLAKGYHVVAKGLSNQRAETLAANVRRWDAYQENAWLGEVDPPIDYGPPVRVFVKRRLKDDLYLHRFSSFYSKNAKTSGHSERHGKLILYHP